MELKDPDRFLENGFLPRWPRRQTDRAEVLSLLVERLVAPGERVTQRELTDQLRLTVWDPTGVRRALVDGGFLARERDGSAYWRP
jgi:hypothetical protein